MKQDSKCAGSKVLVIDDEEPFRHVIVKFLTKQGFQALVARDGKTGLALAAEAHPGLVVCDLNMPGMDGYEVLAALRRDPGLADIPLIFLTGQAEPRHVRQGMSLGADDYLTKPVNLDDLLGAINVRLSRRQAQRRRQEKQMERAMQLFGSIVHDLRDPLFVVLGYTDLLRGSHAKPGGNADQPKQILDRMQKAVLRMQAIVSETLFLARSRMQRLPFDPGQFDLREFCHQMVTDHEESQRLQFQSPGGPFPITADALRLRQALENLLSNALKYSDGPVAAGLSASPKGYLIEIKDQGIGIPAGEQTEIFDPFFRASNTGERPGHGLGLSVVKSCIEQHGGRVWFTSDRSQGTTFCVELPKSSPAKADDAARVPGAPGRLGGGYGVPAAALAHSGIHTHLRREATPAHQPACTPGQSSSADKAGRMRGIIVDDDPLVRNVMRDLLDASNDVVIVGEAGTVAQARLLAKQQAPQVVFLDVNLPDASGFELLPDLKPDASVVFVTSAEEYAVHAFDCEAADYLLKPVEPGAPAKGSGAGAAAFDREARDCSAGGPTVGRFVPGQDIDRETIGEGERDRADHRLWRVFLGLLAEAQEGRVAEEVAQTMAVGASGRAVHPRSPAGDREFGLHGAD